ATAKCRTAPPSGSAALACVCARHPTKSEKRSGAQSEIGGAAMIKISGLCSTFGGPDDLGMSESEGLAFVYEIMDAPHLFLPYQPEGTTGLARRLNPHVHYIACRWNYDVISKAQLWNHEAFVRQATT